MKEWLLVGVLSLVIAACTAEQQEPPPPPAELTREAVGHYCGMTVADHPGPKGQIFVKGREEPLWFSSVRDTVAFTMLPEETDEIRAIYVNDMARATDWTAPEPGAWISALQAYYVIDSARRGGMGALETIPFSSKAAAEKFAHEHGGRVVSFEEIPRDYILGDAEGSADDHGRGEHDRRAPQTKPY